MKLGKALATGVAEETPLVEETGEAEGIEEIPEPVAREEAPAAAR